MTVLRPDDRAMDLHSMLSTLCSSLQIFCLTHFEGSPVDRPLMQPLPIPAARREVTG